MDVYQDKRSVGMSIFLSIITCGIYGYYWLYKLLSSHYRLNNQPNNAGMDIVLYIVTCGIYGIYLGYKMGKLESTSHYVMGFPPRDDSILYLILNLFGLWIVVYAIIQSNLNTMVDQSGGGYGPGGPHGPGPGYGPGGPGHYGHYGPGPQNPQPPQPPQNNQWGQQ